MKDLIIVTGENFNFLNINSLNSNKNIAAGRGKFERKNVWTLLASYYKVRT